MQIHWLHTQINRKLFETGPFWLLFPPHIQIITRNYRQSIPRKSKFRENTKNLSYSLFIEMALSDMNRDFRVKAWIRKSNGKEGGEALNTDNIQISASWDPLTWSHVEWEKHHTWSLCLLWSLFCTYEWSDGQICTSALSLRRLRRVPDCVSQQICIPCSKMPMGSKTLSLSCKRIQHEVTWLLPIQVQTPRKKPQTGLLQS